MPTDENAPQAPSIPAIPERNNSAQFSERMELFCLAFEGFVNFFAENNTYAEGQAQTKLAEAEAGPLSNIDLPANTGRLIAVNAAGDELEAADNPMVTVGSLLNLAKQNRTAADRGMALGTADNNQNNIVLRSLP